MKIIIKEQLYEEGIVLYIALLNNLIKTIKLRNILINSELKILKMYKSMH